MQLRVCDQPDCGRPHHARGLCRMHYKRDRRPPRLDTPERFWQKVLKTESCWIWLGSRTPGGYGTFRVKVPKPERNYGAHQFAFLLTHGYVPTDGMEIDHLCRNRACVNPDHLEAVTHLENMRRRPRRSA